MTSLWQDVAYGFRTMWKKPGFTVVAALSLALGIGANTVVFSLINGLLLRPLDFPEANRLVWIWSVPLKTPSAQGNTLAPSFFALRDGNQSFSAVGGYWGQVTANLGAGEDGTPGEKIFGQHFTPGVFDALGVRPEMGRTFAPDEDQVDNAARVVAISHDFWQRRFHGASDVLGKILRMDGEPYTIIGVMPATFRFFGDDIAFWKPVPMNTTMVQSTGFAMSVIGRLKPGVAIQQAQSEMDAQAAQLAAADPGRNKDTGRHVELLQEGAYGSLRQPLLILQGAVGFVLLIGCANVAGLLLARAASRRTEIAVRTAIGAGRGRIVRQLITESVPLSLLGGLLGIAFAWGGLRLFVAYAPQGFLPLNNFGLDASVLGVTALVAVVTTLVFGIVPAMQASKIELSNSLKESTRGGSEAAARQHIRSGLVVLQIALALILLVGAGLMINSFIRVQNNQLGIDPQNLLTFDVRFSQNDTIKPYGRYRNAGLWDVNPATTITFQRVFERMQSIPGVISAAAAGEPPVSGALGMGFLIDGQPAPPPGQGQQGQNASYMGITPNYFATLRVPIVQGRDFNDRDTAAGAPVIIINQAMAKKYFSSGNPLGHYVSVDYVPDEPMRQIVGVVGDIRLSRTQRQAQPIMYVPHQQQTPRWLGPGWAERSAMYFILRTSSNPKGMIPAMRSALAEVEPDKAPGNIRTVVEYLDRQVQYDRMYMLLLGIFGGIATLLAAIGIYGVMAYAVAERTREIGIRMALGAGSGNVLKLVVRRAFLLVGIGLLLGLGGAFALTRVISSALWEVKATDPLTYASVSLLLVLVALCACLIPTRRAVSVDPTVALRHE
jgi:putative ABC transport system permease protein